MSVAGGIMIRGALVRVLRSTPTRNSDGSSKDSWSELAASRVHIIDGATRQVQEIWGATTEARLIGRAPLDDDLQIDDVLLPQSGPFTDERYRVVERRRETRRQPHLMLALEPTTETFLVDGVTV